MKAIILSICIPTHNGRAHPLSQLLASVFRQIGPELSNVVEVCISDNGSKDETRHIVEHAKASAPCRVTYYRFEQNEGLRNFQNVIAMAGGTFCWMVGSDDLLPPDSISKVVALLRENPRTPGFTINKLNFNSDYSELIGSDNEIVLPSDWQTERVIRGFDSIVQEMYFLFSFISAHVLRKSEWDLALGAMGWQTFERMRHFAFSSVLVDIIRRADEWLWVPDFLVTQRLGNSCLVEDFGDLGYAMQCTEGIQLFIDYTLADCPRPEFVRSRLFRKLLLLYWNPVLILRYKCSPNHGFSADMKMLRFCVSRFRRLPLFWSVSFPALLAPSTIAPALQRAASLLLHTVRRRQMSKARSVLGTRLDDTAKSVLALAQCIKVTADSSGLAR